MSRFRSLRLPLAVLAAWWLAPAAAHAYIGPGAGIAFLGGGLVILSSLVLAVGVLLAFPVKLLLRQITGAGRIKGPTKRLVVIGLDGLDPGLAGRWMAEGKLPELQKLAREGVFRPLATSYPSMSPVAWSSFSTGVDPSRHNIFDFITRDPCTYLPILSSTDIRNAGRILKLGRYRIPLGKPSIKLLRRGKPWWRLLGERKIFSNIIRVPITFPPEPFHGVCLSGMCVPDLKGTQGSFSFWTDDASLAGPEAGGEVNLVARGGKSFRCAIQGPANPMVEGNPVMRLPMRVDVLEEHRRVKITIGKKGDEQHEFELGVREYSEWITLEFSAAPVIGKVTGIARLYVMGTAPFGLYMTPIQIDPANPAMPISHPKVYSVYLAKKLGPYSTLGLAEDTWALNERVIDERAFLEQAWLIFEEREKMLMDALHNTPRGSVVCVFDTTDRVSHMFYRYFEADHPANAGKDCEWGKDAILQTYQKADAMIGRVRERLDARRDRLMVISDHGFCSFQRGVNLNAWLRDEGYLVLERDAPVDEASGKPISRDWMQDVDWSRTRAFSLGLTGMFINRQARERHGIVAEGRELEELKAEIRGKLEGLIDPKTGQRVFREVFDSARIFTGPYVFEAPDLFMGYVRGYRNSWNCATGACPAEVFSDNVKSWSGDHCIDPREVPGVFFCDRPINTDEPNIMDIAPTALELFGVAVPANMQGHALFGPPRPAAPAVRRPAPAAAEVRS